MAGEELAHRDLTGGDAKEVRGAEFPGLALPNSGNELIS